MSSFFGPNTGSPKQNHWSRSCRRAIGSSKGDQKRWTIKMALCPWSP